MYPIHQILLPVRTHAVDILHRDAIIKELLALVREVAQPIPLRRHLRVERPHVVVHYPRVLPDQLLVEDLPLEEGGLGLRVEGPVK